MHRSPPHPRVQPARLRAKRGGFPEKPRRGCQQQLLMQDADVIFDAKQTRESGSEVAF